MGENQPVIARNLTPALLAALADTRVVVLDGARQTGKSALVRWLAANSYPARYVTLDAAGPRGTIRRDLSKAWKDRRLSMRCNGRRSCSCPPRRRWTRMPGQAAFCYRLR